MPHLSLLNTSASTSLLLSSCRGTWARGSRLWLGDTVKAWPVTSLLGPAPAWVFSAAGSSLLKLLLTVAYTDGLGLDSSPVKGQKEMADELFSLGPWQRLLYGKQESISHFSPQSPGDFTPRLSGKTLPFSSFPAALYFPIPKLSYVGKDLRA